MENPKVQIGHCKEEQDLLDLLKELRYILGDALDSLANQNQTPQSAESRYVSDAAVSVNHLSDGYILLRDSGRVHTSKVLIRPLIDIVIKATAATKRKGFLFRIAYTELQEMKKLYDDTPENAAEAAKCEEALKRQFSKEPGYPIECKQVNGRYAAEVAEMLENYDTAYRIYCEFTHSAVRAVRGTLNPTTDPIDTTMVIWAVVMMLNQLKAFTPAKIIDLSSFNGRIILAQAAMLKAFGHTIS